jgi:hypothetical protein
MAVTLSNCRTKKLSSRGKAEAPAVIPVTPPDDIIFWICLLDHLGRVSYLVARRFSIGVAAFHDLSFIDIVRIVIRRLAKLHVKVFLCGVAIIGINVSVQGWYRHVVSAMEMTGDFAVAGPGHRLRNALLPNASGFGREQDARGLPQEFICISLVCPWGVRS